jgi:hypothetical protein
MQSVASTHPSSPSSPRDLCDDVTCTIRVASPPVLRPDWETEGLEKATRGGEWESIKITHRNLAYIPNRTWCSSLLTRPRPHSYSKTIGPRNWVRNRSENMNRCQQDHMRDQRQKLDWRTFYIFTDISLTLGGCDQKITVGERFEPWIFEFFDPVTQ